MKLLLDSANPEETQQALDTLGFLDGQTTNPTLLSKNPKIKTVGSLTEESLRAFYRQTVQTIASLIPQGAISIEMYANSTTPEEAMLEQAREMFRWIPNAYIKFPTTVAGIAAARRALEEGIRINMTLVFSLAQAAAVYVASRDHYRKPPKLGDFPTVLLSPFVGRLDDAGGNGVGLVADILDLYRQGDGHVGVLTASVRSLDHLTLALQLGSPMVTAPLAVLKQWKEKRVPPIDFTRDWRSFDLSHPLTQKGMEWFAADWKSLVDQH